MFSGLIYIEVYVRFSVLFKGEWHSAFFFSPFPQTRATTSCQTLSLGTVTLAVAILTDTRHLGSVGGLHFLVIGDIQYLFWALWGIVLESKALSFTVLSILWCWLQAEQGKWTSRVRVNKLTEHLLCPEDFSRLTLWLTVLLVLFWCFETDSCTHLYQRIALNFWSYCLCPPSAGISGMYHHAQLCCMSYWWSIHQPRHFYFS